MNWICVTLITCLSFNPEMDYTNNNEFIEDVRACTVHLNSMYPEHERIPVNVSWGLRIFETKCESISYYIELLNNSHHYKDFREERLMQYINDIVDLERLAKTLAIYAEDVYYTRKIIQTLRELNDN